MPKTATPRKPETVSRKLAETRAKSKNRSLSSLLGIGDNEKRLATDIGSGLNDVIGRGTIAGLLGLPGDLSGAAENGLRSLLGLPQVTPYGGSEHIGQKMEQAGLVSSVRRPKTELLASLISPAQAATAGYKAPQMARAGVQMMDNLTSAPTMARIGQRGAVETNMKGLQGLVGGGDNAPMGNPIEVWHGTDVEFGRPNTPLFLGDRPMAEAYARRRAEESGFSPILMGGTANFKKIASEDDVKRIAKSVGVVVENDMAFHALDPNINGRHNSQKLIDALRAEGYDSAHIDDFSPDDPFKLTKSYVALDPDQLSLKPVGNLGKMVAPQDEALRVAQANALPDTDAGYAPLGSWVRDPFAVEGKTPIRQVREIPLDRLVLPELDTAGKILPHKAAYVERYAEAMRNGDVFPNLRGSELENGMIKIQDGHRRALAAKLAGKDSVLVNVDDIGDYWIPAE